MPNETINLRRFNVGTITNPDAEDINLESASDSLNVDGDLNDGKLRAIPTNSATGAYQANGNVEIVNVRLAAFIQKDNLITPQYDLIYHDALDEDITAVTDFYDTEANRTLTDLITTNISDETVIIPNNREVHIGTGNGSANVPKWVGYIDSRQVSHLSGEYFVGTGLEDATFSGTASITGLNIIHVYIFTTGATDQLKWSLNGGTDSSAINLGVDGGNTNILTGTGKTITWGATTGHTVNDDWYFIINSATTTLQVENAGLSTGNLAPDITSSNQHATVGSDYFQAGDCYVYGASYVYDGYQESVLSGIENNINGFVITAGNSSEKIDIDVKISMGDTINKRITAVKIYRAEATRRSSAPYLYDAEGTFRLIGDIDINDSNWTTNAVGQFVYAFDDIGEVIGGSYEEETGIAQTLEDPIVNYSLACKGNGFLFVGKCYHPSISEASQYIFRSKEKRFDMFDWSKDIIRLPRVPTAMAFYLGRLYAFDANNVYVINPDQMFIEDILPGMGAIGQRSVCVTPSGMFFCNSKGAWMHDGQNIILISNRIKQSSSGGSSWLYLKNTFLTDIIVIYMSKRGDGVTPTYFNSDYVLFVGDDAGTPDVTRCWAYHISKDRWDYWSLGGIQVDANSGAFNGKDGEVFFSNASETVQLLAGASRQAFTFVSQDITMDDPSQRKMWYDISVDEVGTGSVTTTFGVEGAAPTTALTSTTKIQSGGDYIYAKSLKFKIVSTGVADVESVAVIARRLIGARVA